MKSFIPILFLQLVLLVCCANPANQEQPVNQETEENNAPLLSDDCSLAALIVNPGFLEEPFRSDKTEYTLRQIPQELGPITCTATQKEEGQLITIQFNDEPYIGLTSGTTSESFVPILGENSIIIRVVAPDGIQSRNYTLVFKSFSLVDENAPDFTTGWYNLQHPLTVTSTAGSKVSFFGQAYRAEKTEAEGQASGLIAEFGIGPFESNPHLSDAWSYHQAGFNRQAGNNDEFTYELTIPDNSNGEYSYTFRYSWDGVSWIYGDTSGVGLTNPFDETELGKLTIQ